LAQNKSTKRRAAKIHSSAGATCRRAEENKKKGRKKEEKRHPKQCQTRPPTSSDQNQTLHGGWPALCSYISSVIQIGYWVTALWRVGREGRKWPFSISLARDYCTSHD